MRTLVTVAALFALSAAAFGQDPNRNRMNEEYPEARSQENLGKAPAGAPPAHANRMNVEVSAAPATDLAGGPNPSANRMNVDWAQPESHAQADKAGKHKGR